MAASFDQGFLKAVSEGIHILAEQKFSKLIGLVSKSSKVGDYVFFDTITNDSDMAQVATNKATTVLSDVTNARRGLRNTLYMKHYYRDTVDQIKSMNDPSDHYTVLLARKVAHQIDKWIIDAAFGSALTGADGGGTQALPAGQKIVVDFDGDLTDEGLTVEKLIEAARILDANEIEETGRYCIIGAKPLAQLLNTTKATSADYNSVRALVNGEIDTFMGLKFVKSQKLGVDGNADNRVLVFQEDAIIFNSPMMTQFKTAEREDLSYMHQASAILAGGAVRIEDAGVVEIACDPTA